MTEIRVQDKNIKEKYNFVNISCCLHAKPKDTKKAGATFCSYKLKHCSRLVSCSFLVHLPNLQAIYLKLKILNLSRKW